MPFDECSRATRLEATIKATKIAPNTKQDSLILDTVLLTDGKSVGCFSWLVGLLIEKLGLFIAKLREFLRELHLPGSREYFENPPSIIVSVSSSCVRLRPRAAGISLEDVHTLCLEFGLIIFVVTLLKTLHSTHPDNNHF